MQLREDLRDSERLSDFAPLYGRAFDRCSGWGSRDAREHCGRLHAVQQAAAQGPGAQRTFSIEVQAEGAVAYSGRKVASGFEISCRCPPGSAVFLHTIDAHDNAEKHSLKLHPLAD